MLKELLRHSSLYAMAMVISRLASVLMLPVYTRYLSPADYGCIAVLDTTAAFVGVITMTALVNSVTRFHFDDADARERSAVWWTGFTCIAALVVVVLIPSYLGSGPIAYLLLGPEQEQGGDYVRLMVLTLAAAAVGEVPLAYARSRKWSGYVLLYTLTRLPMNIALNLWFLIAAGQGVRGLLMGNLITGVVMAAAGWLWLIGYIGRYAFHGHKARQLTSFAWPLVGIGMSALFMHNADRYFLRLFLPLDQVGLYSLAYSLGQGLNGLLLLPFASSWGVMVYEIKDERKAAQQSVQVFSIYVRISILALLAASLLAPQIVALMASPRFAGAADLLPVVCLAYFFFGLHKHFEIPMLRKKKTVALLLPSVVAAAVNGAANFALIPYLGSAGAAWASVITFAVFSFGGLAYYRRFGHYDYPLGLCSLQLAGAFLTWMGHRAFTALVPGQAASILFALAACLVWAALFFGPMLAQAYALRRDPLRGELLPPS